MFQGFPIITVIILLPLIGAVATFLLGKREEYAKWVAAIFSAAALVLSVLVAFSFVIEPTQDTASGYRSGGEHYFNFQFYENYTWIESLGINYIVGLDGISLPLFILTTLLSFLAIVFSWDTKLRPKEYFGLMQILELGVLGVFVAQDYFLFYVFWEVVLIPMYFMIGVWGGPNKDYAAIKFFIYTHVASLAILISIMALYFQAGRSSFSMETIANANSGLTAFPQLFQVGIFAAMFFGFGVKMPMVPFHTWLPDAHVEAPTAGSVLLAGLLLKMGGYGIIRIAIPTLQQGAMDLQILMAVIAIASILYGAMLCLAQKDLKKMVAYSSISHMGFVLLGFATFTSVGITAGVFQMFAHGLVTAVLFMMCGVVQHKAGTRLIPNLGGLSKKMPIGATMMTIGFLASLGLPGLVSFAAEFMVFWSVFETWGLWLLLPIISVAITAGYYLWALQKSMFGPLTEKIDTSHLKDVDWFEGVPVGVLIALIAIFGVFPLVIFQYINPAVEIVVRILGG